MDLAPALDPYEKPPDHIRNVYKKYQKMKLKDLDQDVDIIDFARGLSDGQKESLTVIRELEFDQLVPVLKAFEGPESAPRIMDSPIHIYEHLDLPGLHIIPRLLPTSTQLTLLSRLLHRDLSNPSHLTNIHTHYTLTYPSPSQPPSSSFFSTSPTSPHPLALPLSPTLHPPLPIHHLLTRKLRWLTLGGQYDWTLKRYPSTAPPAFPADIATLLASIFPETKPQAAIVNLYSPGDKLSVHRDVAEGSRAGLGSVSLGCEGVFVVGGTGRKERGEGREKDVTLTLRLPSGSAVYMSGEARFAWHGVPQIIAGTCPEELADWPAGMAEGVEEGVFEEWRGWMRNKRVNLNVRQMWD
ncbi:hypothetical protein K432DRAFT_107599 [Lepidopterella palustris CBS 459.81]|uniref:mRNA N(6)-methyladenine demethylase n=1 Tax=Lepidopterella palustris CBS 459.81 TaxID=1314670 RepID=A0A8E2EJF4_9PEZI|nr:hypothetical protein K432DRAFT_107599 [Lepidopterella palustris CBS 459.81]